MSRYLRHLSAALLIALSVGACTRTDPEQSVADFCATLQQVNAGAVDTAGLAELSGHARVIATLVEAAPPSLAEDLQRIYDTVAAWASAVSGEQSMLDTFDTLTAPKLIGSQGRVTDFIARHCQLDLGGPRWREAERPDAGGICPAWPRVGTPLTFNNFPNLPDIAGSNYFAQNFVISGFLSALGLDTIRGAFVVEPGGRAVFRGRYPEARYFAFHPNDMDLNNLATLRDRDLEPDPGSVNPFRQVDVEGAGNYYTASLVFGPAPSKPEPNTSYVGLRKGGAGDNSFVVNLMRMYHIDAGNGAGSGEVPLPALSIYGSDGELDRHFAECDLFAPGNPDIRTEQVFPAMPVIDHRASNPPRWTTSSNFEAPSDTLANADVQYLGTQYSERFGELFVVRARYLSAPDTRGGESPAEPGKDIRLYNICTYNFWNGGATQCRLENELLRDEAGFYTLVVSRAEHRPANLEHSAATWMDWGPYLDGQLTWRFVFRENPYAEAIAAAVDGGEVDRAMLPYVPVAAPCDRATYEAGGWQACFERQAVDVSRYQ